MTRPRRFVPTLKPGDAALPEATEGVRTLDLPITNRVLYQLSYCGNAQGDPWRRPYTCGSLRQYMASPFP